VELSSEERDCLDRFVELLRAELGDDLERVVLFGSAARGDMWPASSPMHSDIDILVVTRNLLGEADQERLINETYPLYLECGRQIGPQFRTVAWLERPPTEQDMRFAQNVERDGRRLI
jgi:predicted nucleotidyltransferase